jgi:hypothetical protein
MSAGDMISDFCDELEEYMREYSEEGVIHADHQLILNAITSIRKVVDYEESFGCRAYMEKLRELDDYIQRSFSFVNFSDGRREARRPRSPQPASQKLADKALIKEFYAMLAMLDMREGPANTFGHPGKPNVRITAKSTADEVTARILGGKNQALKLLRHCEMARLVCRHDENAFGILGSAFLRIAERWPLLRSYYEGAKEGAYPHTWYRHRRA